MRDHICAMCEHFKRRDKDGVLLPQIEHGIGRCAGYDGHVLPVQPFVRWDAAYCVNFSKAADMAKRIQWIEMRKREEDEKAKAPKVNAPFVAVLYEKPGKQVNAASLKGGVD